MESLLGTGSNFGQAAKTMDVKQFCDFAILVILRARGGPPKAWACQATRKYKVRLIDWSTNIQQRTFYQTRFQNQTGERKGKNKTHFDQRYSLLHPQKGDKQNERGNQDGGAGGASTEEQSHLQEPRRGELEIPLLLSGNPTTYGRTRTNTTFSL